LSAKLFPALYGLLEWTKYSTYRVAPK